MPAWLGPAIAAGASLLGGAISARQNRKQFESNAALQREFAQHGIRWKVADARAAGVHPVYALGAQTASYQPSTSVDPMGPALADAGRHASEGYDRYRDSKRQFSRDWNAHNLAMDQMESRTLAIKRQKLENDILEKELDSMGQSTARRGRGDANYVDELDAEPAFKEYNTQFGPMLLFYSQEGPTEGFDVGLDGRILTIHANMEYYGDRWLEKMLESGPDWIRDTYNSDPKAFGHKAKTKALEHIAPLIIEEVMP